jgi:CrcB protein
MLRILLVGLGGFAGAIARYGLGGWVHRSTGSVAFPYGTLVVNVLGCLCIGAISGIAESRGVFGPETRVFLLIGLLGGFTTFSSFGYETLQLLRDGQSVYGLVNVLANVLLGLAAVWFGWALARWIA